MAADSNALIARVPKVELHLHLEGSILPATMEELTRRTDPGFSIDKLEWPGKSYTYNGLTQFVSIMKTVMNNCLRTTEDYERVAYEAVTDLARQNVRYAEISFDPFRGRRLNIPFKEMFAAVVRGRDRAMQENPIRIGLILGFGRENGAHLAGEFVKMAALVKDTGMVGIDMHGNESAVAAEQFEAVYAAAAAAGLGLRAHAGEGSGAQSVWEAIRSLQVNRIGHGIRATEDPALVEYLAAHPITLDVCPTSNVRLGICKDIKKHPIRPLFDAGVRVSVNTDDPFFFQTSITGEYRVLHEELGFDCEELKKVTMNAVEGAFLPDDEKAKLKAEIEADFPDTK